MEFDNLMIITDNGPLLPRAIINDILGRIEEAVNLDNEKKKIERNMRSLTNSFEATLTKTISRRTFNLITGWATNNELKMAHFPMRRRWIHKYEYNRKSYKRKLWSIMKKRRHNRKIPERMIYRP